MYNPINNMAGWLFPNATYNDDVFQGWFGIGSQIDGLGPTSAAPDGVYYNCNDIKDFGFLTGLTKLGIENCSTDRSSRHCA